MFFLLLFLILYVYSINIVKSFYGALAIMRWNIPNVLFYNSKERQNLEIRLNTILRENYDEKIYFIQDEKFDWKNFIQMYSFYKERKESSTPIKTSYHNKNKIIEVNFLKNEYDNLIEIYEKNQFFSLYYTNVFEILAGNSMLNPILENLAELNSKVKIFTRETLKNKEVNLSEQYLKEKMISFFEKTKYKYIQSSIEKKKNSLYINLNLSDKVFFNNVVRNIEYFIYYDKDNFFTVSQPRIKYIGKLSFFYELYLGLRIKPIKLIKSISKRVFIFYIVTMIFSAIVTLIMFFLICFIIKKIKTLLKQDIQKGEPDEKNN